MSDNSWKYDPNAPLPDLRKRVGKASYDPGPAPETVKVYVEQPKFAPVVKVDHQPKDPVKTAPAPVGRPTVAAPGVTRDAINAKRRRPIFGIDCDAEARLVARSRT